MKALEDIIFMCLVVMTIGNRTTTPTLNDKPFLVQALKSPQPGSVAILIDSPVMQEIHDVSQNDTISNEENVEKIDVPENAITLAEQNNESYVPLINKPSAIINPTLEDSVINSNADSTENATLNIHNHQNASETFSVVIIDSEEPPTGCNFTSYSGELHVICSNVSIYDISKYLPTRTKKLLMMNGKNMSKLMNGVISHLSNLESLSISNSGVNYVTPSFFTGLSNLRKLSLANNWIRVLLARTFNSTPKLEEITLSQNLILRLDRFSDALESLRNLKILNMQGNVVLNRISADALKPLVNSTLEEVDLSECQLMSIELGAFRPLRNLRVLDLSTNLFNAAALYNVTASLEGTDIRELRMRDLPEVVRTSPFPASAMAQLQRTKIERIDLGNNNFRKLPDFAFTNLTTLKHLNLRSCGIEMIMDLAFYNSINLEVLDLQENKLYSIGAGILALTNLRELILKNPHRGAQNVIFYLKANTFITLTRLETLDMSSVPIGDDINKNVLSGLVHLKRLRLHGCSISHVADFAFSELRFLEVLDISYNAIAEISNYTFHGLRNLKTLYLNGNSLTLSPNVSPFMQTPSLESLLLIENKLTFLHASTFAGLDKLQLLLLSRNSIKPWNQRLIPNNANLNALTLDSNEISHVTTAMLEDFHKAEVLDLRYNPFECDFCGMNDFQVWLLTTNTTIDLKEDIDSYICVAPTHLKGQSIFNVTVPIDHCFPKEIDIVFISTISVVIPLTFIAAIALTVYFLRWYIRYWFFLLRTNVRKYRQSVNYKKYDYDAFVSYCVTESEWVVKQLVPILEGQNSNLKLCLHDRDFEVGRFITDNILESIEKSRKTVMVLSEAYVRSKWCMLELHMAQHKLFDDTRDALVLIELKELDKKKLPKTLKYLVKTRTYIPWTSSVIGQKLFWERLKDALKKPSDTMEMKRIV